MSRKANCWDSEYMEVCLRSDPRTRRYVDRRTAEGLSKPEILRCLKRYIAREVFKILQGPSGLARNDSDAPYWNTIRCASLATGRNVLQAPDPNPTVDFHGDKRSSATHESKTDPDAKLARKGNGKEAKHSYSAHALMENRNGLIVDLRIDEADGRAERRNALEMLDNLLHLGAAAHSQPLEALAVRCADQLRPTIGVSVHAYAHECWVTVEGM